MAVQRERPYDRMPLGEGMDTVMSPPRLAASNEPALPTDLKVDPGSHSLRRSPRRGT
jgi:hypothetical protein